ncbi:MAG: ATP-dependent DNA helicase [Promethearchaeota archaeon]|nr:MAG: ATP-dependent DNA helicase [Candidatus Lokiarchaeota archaeon]
MMNMKMNLTFKDFFPYSEYRKGQETIIKQIEESAFQKRNILLSAPNGTGKTIIALSALLPVAIKNNLKILYLCRTHSQNSRVIKELIKISAVISNRHKEVRINGLSIRGRNEMCLNENLISQHPNPRDSMSICRDLRKNRSCRYFVNLIKKKNELKNPVLISPETLDKPFDADVLINLCQDKKLCPYFLSKFLLSEMQVIICNYQWVFNPFIRQTFLKFIGKELQNCILVLDEAHNLIDVSTEVNSLRISPYLLARCLTDVDRIRARAGIMRRFILLLQNQLDKKKSNLNAAETPIKPEKILNSIITKLGYADLTQFETLLQEIDDYGLALQEEKIVNGEFAPNFLSSLAEFWQKWIRCYSLENYFFCYTLRSTHNKRKKSVSIEIVALDPREVTIPLLSTCYTSLHLSGTINPYVYNHLMGLMKTGKPYKGIIADSPFKKKNIRALITEGVDTRRKNRTPKMFKQMIEKVDEVLYCTPKNVGIFCASYKILKSLLNHGIEQVVVKNHKKLFIEKPGLSASENAYLIKDFKSMTSRKNSGGVLLGVCGGRNSEGEDYPGDYMNSVVIAGFPYHLPTPRVNAKIQYYDSVFDHQGWEFAYLYPAIQRANQASGRPIRKLTDKGAIIFMDTRFKQKYNWISDWVRKEIDVVPDRKNAIIQKLYPFWHP